MQDQQDPFTEESLFQTVSQFDWTDAEQDPSPLPPHNPFFQFDIPQHYAKHYRLLRTMLNRQQKSRRCLALTALMLRIRPGNYYALMLRKDCITQQSLNQEELVREVLFVNCLLALNPKEYQLWTYKKNILQNHLFPLYELEVVFLDELLQLDTKNYHVWDYKLWLTIFFQQQQQQLEWSQRLLFEPPLHKNLQQGLDGSGLEVQGIDWSNCYSLWSYRCNLSQQAFRSSEERAVFQAKEVERVLEWLEKQDYATNECGWIYLAGLAHSFALDIAILQKIFSFSSSAMEKAPKNRFAGNTCMQLGELLASRCGGEFASREKVIESMKQNDKVRSPYYQYLLFQGELSVSEK